MELKKRIAMLALILVLTLTSATGVSAMQGFAYGPITVPRSQDATLAPATANQNYRYVLNYITSKSGGAAVHSSYYTYYNGTLIGSSIKTETVGSAIWKPNNYINATNPSGWNIVGSPGGCPASASSYCAVKGESYTLFLDNKNILNPFTISGQFTFTNY